MTENITERTIVRDLVVNLEEPIDQMQVEHERAGHALVRMRELTSGYRLPGDACPSFTALYEGLAAVEAGLHEHVHLENNILIPRVLALAGKAGEVCPGWPR